MTDAISLTQAWWTFIGVADGFVLLTNPLLGTSRWIDARIWPPRIGEPMKHLTRALASGPRLATLVGWNPQLVRLQSGPAGKPTDIALPTKKHGYRALGYVGKRLVLVPGHLGLDNKSSPLTVGKAPIARDGNAWTTLEGESGPHWTLAGVAGGFVIWGGAINKLEGNTLVRVGELPRSDGDWQTQPSALPGGFAIAAGGKLALWRDNELELHAVGKGKVVHVQANEEQVLVRTAGPHAFWSFDVTTAKATRLQVKAEEVFDTPASRLALVEDGLELVRL